MSIKTHHTINNTRVQRRRQCWFRRFQGRILIYLFVIIWVSGCSVYGEILACNLSRAAHNRRFTIVCWFGGLESLLNLFGHVKGRYLQRHIRFSHVFLRQYVWYCTSHFPNFHSRRMQKNHPAKESRKRVPWELRSKHFFWCEIGVVRVSGQFKWIEGRVCAFFVLMRTMPLTRVRVLKS